MTTATTTASRLGNATVGRDRRNQNMIFCGGPIGPDRLVFMGQSFYAEMVDGMGLYGTEVWHGPTS